MSELLIYSAGGARVDARLERITVWLARRCLPLYDEDRLNLLVSSEPNS